MIRLRKMRLATKTAIVLGGTATVILAILIIFTVISSSRALRTSAFSELALMSETGSIKVQQIIDAATDVAKNMESYLVKEYNKTDQRNKQYSAENASESSQKYISEIYNKEITKASYEAERFLIETARNTAVNNVDIIGVGAFFEPYQYDENIESYAFYINENNKDDKVEPFGDYSAYSKEVYYTQAMQQNQVVFTQPYLFDNNMIVSVAYPIIFQNKLKGVINADINVSNFDKIVIENSLYPSLYSTVYDGEGTIIYDSESPDNVGKNMKEFFSNETDYTTVVENFSKKEPFSIDTHRETGEVYTRFFNPVNAGTQTWWSLTAVSEKDLNSSATKMAIGMSIFSIVALLILIAVTVLLLFKFLNPIKGIVEAAQSISRGNFEIELTAKSGDEIGILTYTFNQTAKQLKTIVTDISNVLNHVANKDLDVSTSVEYVGEMKQIETSINLIIQSLNGVMRDIGHSANQTSTGAEQVSSGAQALSQGATEQASSVEELSATITEISQHIQKSAANAEKAKEESIVSGEEILNMNRQMQEMIAAMSDISGKSGEISKIIKNIEDIAFQTNILALNAAVEAARAGAAGKGFAVVADEVRNLASKSAAAAKNTTALIGDTIKAVENGTKIADETAKSMLSVVDGSKRVTSIVEEIASASIEQADAVAQVTEGINQISAVVQTNSATAQESAAASEELSSQAQIMKNMVEQFRIKREL